MGPYVLSESESCTYEMLVFTGAEQRLLFIDHRLNAVQAILKHVDCTQYRSFIHLVHPITSVVTRLQHSGRPPVMGCVPCAVLRLT